MSAESCTEAIAGAIPHGRTLAPRRRKAENPAMRPIQVLLLLVVCATLPTACKNPDRASAPTDGAEAKPSALEGRTWTLHELQREPVSGTPPWLRFEKGIASGFGGINRLTCPYAIDGNVLTLGAIASTRMAGEPARMELEQRFTDVLALVDGFRIDGDVLELTSRGVLVARFRTSG
jgi:heat shock protein HslJ